MSASDLDEPRVLIPARVHRELLRESRQVELLGYLVAAMGVGAALLLYNAGDRSFWMVVFGVVGVLAAVWAVVLGRRHDYRIQRAEPPSGMPYVDRTARPMLESPTHGDGFTGDPN